MFSIFTRFSRIFPRVKSVNNPSLSFNEFFCVLICRLNQSYPVLSLEQKSFQKMAQESGKHKNTAYGVFVQACWAQHKRQYPDELIHKEIEEFNKQCSVWWYNLSEQERERFQEMADRSNAQQALQQSYTHVNTNNAIHANPSIVQNAVSSTSAGGIPSFGSSFAYSDYSNQLAGGQVVNAVVDQSGTVLNYSTNTAPGTCPSKIYMSTFILHSLFLLRANDSTTNSYGSSTTTSWTAGCPATGQGWQAHEGPQRA